MLGAARDVRNTSGISIIARGVQRRETGIQARSYSCVGPNAGHALRGRLRGLRSLRVGAYRIIYQVTDSDQNVRVATVRHRSIAYRTDPR